VNNDSDPADFSIHLFSESLIHIPGIFIQNLSERPIHIARNPQSEQLLGENKALFWFTPEEEGSPRLSRLSHRDGRILRSR